jgi:tetratricopeptide (TPR) repeat protein
VQAQEQQIALAREAERLRNLVAAQALGLDDAARRARDAERDAAYNRLIAQALLAQRQNNFNVSVQVFQSAVALKPNDDGFRQLALARAKADETARANAAEALAKRERDQRSQLEKELVQARDQVAAERRKRDEEEKKRLAVQKERDDATYKRLLDAAEAAGAKGNYDEAVASLQSARALRNSDEVNRLLSDALVNQAKEAAAKKGAAEKEALEKQLADEKQNREAAEVEAKKNAELYNSALKLAQEAMAQKKYAQAVTKYQEAAKVFRTDVVLTGLKAAQDAQAKERADADAALAKQVAEKKKAEDLKNFIDKGQKALTAKQYDDAIQAFTQAKGIDPSNIDALTGLSKAQHAKEEALAQAKKKEGDAQKIAKIKEALDQGRTALAKKDFVAAGKALDAASQLDPKNPDLVKFKTDLQTARDGSSADAELKKKKAEYDKLIQSGKDALIEKEYDQAVKLFKDAGKLLPDDRAWQDNLRQAQKAADAKALAEKQQEDKLRIEIKQLVADARADIKAGKFDAAAKVLADAKKLDPKDAGVVGALKDLEDARTQAAADAMKKQREADYQKVLKAGKDLLAAKKYEDAIKSFKDAGKLLPDDRAWQDLLKQAEDAKRKKGEEEELQQLVSAAEADIKAGKLDDAAKAIANAKKIDPKDTGVVKAAQDLETARAALANDTAKKQRQADYEKAMKAGRDAMTAKKYDDAIRDFTDAAKLMPGDKDAGALLKQAQQAKADLQGAAEAEAKKKQEEKDKKAEYAKLMDQGQSQLSARKYDDAAKSFSDALKLIPNDAKATASLKSANFQQHMAEGQRLLNAKKFMDAANEFQEALKIIPDDANAKALLKKAKDGK